MAKVFSVASWNVEHFKDDPTRIDRVIDLVKAQNPDVFGLYEVEGATVFTSLVSKMPNYMFQITEGVQTQGTPRRPAVDLDATLVEVA